MHTEAELRAVAHRRVQDRTGLVVHILMYAVLNLGLVGIWAINGHGYPWFLWPVLTWGVAIAAHAVTYWFGAGSPYEDRAVARELHKLER
jgi:hypothetical protein